jgi:hypothetical protein
LRGAWEARYDVSVMDLHPLDNPIWSALQTAHAHVSLGNAALKMYHRAWIGPLGSREARGLMDICLPANSGRPPMSEPSKLGGRSTLPALH